MDTKHLAHQLKEHSRKILFIASLAALSYVCYRSFWLNRKVSHLLILRDKLILSKISLKSPPLNEMKIYSFSEFQKGKIPKTQGFDIRKLLNSTNPGVLRYAANVMYSHITTSTAKVFDTIDGIKEGLLYVADLQTQGTGRTGPWMSEPGSLLYSYLFSCHAQHAVMIQLIVPLAIIRAIVKIGTRNGISQERLDYVKLKWPNDILYRDVKIAGILVNSKSEGKDFVMNIGIGINCDNKKPTTCLNLEYGGIFTKEDLVAEYLAEFSEICDLLEKQGGYEKIRDEYKLKWYHYNKIVDLPNQKVKGKLIDITEDGVLHVEDDEGNGYQVHSREEIIF
ncbi:unnamed protein product [Blepharisma stoltei]|uniref:BPL/LPL catalytic domain-containing protein n=1 Tax=Blepharisma stoltei TaxID=1481888 RepID=A0AAU9JF19_9CILI|nr:unnamed protein product [Blepharisma stoltei]